MASKNDGWNERNRKVTEEKPIVFKELLGGHLSLDLPDDVTDLKMRIQHTVDSPQTNTRFWQLC